jgi:hypothetical protein
LCVYIKGSRDEKLGYWLNTECTNLDGGVFLPACERPAISGPIVPDDQPLPTSEPNDYCSVGWHYLTHNKKCYMENKHAQSWKISSDYCLQNGGELASINSPDDQGEVNH